jgi:dynamin 1-like protein
LKDGDKEWVEFLDKRGEKIYNLEDVKSKIESETEKLAGKFKSISPVPIKIKFFSPNVVDLLLVDLPGMTKNPVGD